MNLNNDDDLKNKEDLYIAEGTRRWTWTYSTFRQFCQAQPKPQLQLSWGLSLHYSQCDPAGHPAGRRNSKFFVS